MIFSFVNKPYTVKQNMLINSNIFLSENVNKSPVKKIQKKIQKRKPKTNNKILLSFSEISPLSGSMFQRIQNASSGCGACGGR